MIPIYTVAAIRRLETLAAARPGAPALMERADRFTTGTLMERAGVVAAEHARRLCGDTAKDILVLAGPGNNGGDAFEVAAHLKRWFFRVSVVFAGERDRLSKDARAALAKWDAAGGMIEQDIPRNIRFGLVIDGLFGIGLQRPLEGRHAALVEKINAQGAPILALDIPSGLNADTGAVMGCAVRATHTVTFIALKPGLLTLDGPDHCGELAVDALGLDPAKLLAPEGELLDAGVLARALPPRRKNFHKGMAGSVGILGGAAGMIGAALIAGRAALRCGAGRVYLGLLAPDAPLADAAQPELMLREPRDILDKNLAQIVAAGPGMGNSKAAETLLRAALKSQATLVLDADALNLLANDRLLRANLGKRAAATVLTPHPAEAARLLGGDTGAVQSDRLAAARAIAARYGSLVVLKGNGSIVAAPDGRWWINPSGNPGMASAGMGDALTGMIASFAAQGATPPDALLAGVWLHGAAADELARGGSGPVGITASEVVDGARALLNRRGPAA